MKSWQHWIQWQFCVSVLVSLQCKGISAQKVVMKVFACKDAHTGTCVVLYFNLSARWCVTKTFTKYRVFQDTVLMFIIYFYDCYYWINLLFIGPGFFIHALLLQFENRLFFSLWRMHNLFLASCSFRSSDNMFRILKHLRNLKLKFLSLLQNSGYFMTTVGWAKFSYIKEEL